MQSYEITMFFNRMRYLSGTGQLGGLNTLVFGSVKFRLCPAIDDNTAYPLFGYLSEHYGQLSAEDKTLEWLCLNAAAYMVDNHVGYEVKFCRNLDKGILWNLREMFRSRHLRRFIQQMQCDTNTMWIPTCEAALQGIGAIKSI